MKILLVNNNYPSNNNPNQATYIKSIKECLELAGLEVELLVTYSRKNIFSKLVNHCLFYIKLIFFDYSNFDYVYINHFHSVSLPLLLNFSRMQKIIVHWHGEDLMCSNILRRKKNDFLNIFLPTDITHIVPSDYFSQILSSRLNVQNILVSPSGGVAIDVFSKNKINQDSEEIHLGFVSGLVFEKGLELIISMINRLEFIQRKTNKTIILHYIDFGTDKKYFNSHPFPKHFLNRWDKMSKEEMPLFYNSINILLFPTNRLAESLGLVALEAMSCGVPVVGTHDFALEEYILSRETGEKFTRNNYSSFENALIFCIQNIQTYNTRSLIKEKYSRESVVQGYKKMFEKINKD